MALLCLGAAAVPLAVSSGRLPKELLFGIEGAGLAALLLALAFARSDWALWAVGLVAVAEGAAFALRAPALLAPFMGALLLISAELALWAIERARPAQEAIAVGLFRAVRLSALALAGCGFGLLALAGSDLAVSGGFDLTAVGVAAVVAILGLVFWLGRGALRAGVRG